MPVAETFSLWTPGLAKASDNDRVRKICGLASTEDTDQQGESILQKGIDFSPLVHHGHINWNHKPGAEYIIGEPTNVDFRDTRNGYGLYMEGVLYKGIPAADAVWNLILAVEDARESGASRRQLGWSVEGGIVQRDPEKPKIIRKSIVRHMAVTHEPVNARTYLELAKSMGHEWAGLSEFDIDEVRHHTFETVDDLAKSFGVGLVKTMAAQIGISGTGDMAPLMHMGHKGNQNIVEHAAEFLCELGDECDGTCKKVRKGKEKALTHLVKCMNIDAEVAVEVVIALAKTLG